MFSVIELCIAEGQYLFFLSPNNSEELYQYENLKMKSQDRSEFLTAEAPSALFKSIKDSCAVKWTVLKCIIKNSPPGDEMRIVSL